jgi:probable F420-dependent oxidoreductase
MLLGVMPSLTGVSPTLLPSLLQTLEDVACESVWVAEHVVVPVEYESLYPYRDTGRMYMEATDDAPDPLDWLAFAAACTKRLKLGTAMLLLPEHNPVILAKRLATVDFLSSGRLLAGVSIGWLREEYASLGVPFERRGERADEYLRAMRCLWAADVASFKGEWTQFDGVACRPRPMRAGGVPVVIGGGSRAAARRAAQYADGFFPLAGSTDALIAVIKMLGEECDRAGRDPHDVQVTTFAPGSPRELHALREVNVQRVVLPVPFANVDTLVHAIGSYRGSFGDDLG